MKKYLIAFFIVLFLFIKSCVSVHAWNLQDVSNELYLCDYVWHTTETKYWKIAGLVYFECFYTLDEMTITSEYKTLVVLSKNDMFVVGGWKN